MSSKENGTDFSYSTKRSKYIIQPKEQNVYTAVIHTSCVSFAYLPVFHL